MNYKIIGDLTQVASAQIQIKDDTGQVVFSTPVPVQPTGLVIWPAGQPIHVTPATISFQVQNPDGGNSDFLPAVPENTFGSAPTPVILSASPSSIVVGSSRSVIDIFGRNFLTSTQAQFISPGSDVTDAAALLPIQFISPTEIKLTVAPAYLTQLGDATLRLLNGTTASNDYTIHIVPPGLPPAPTLTSINPSQLALTDTPQDALVVLSGTNFVVGDTVVRADSENSAAPALVI